MSQTAEGTIWYQDNGQQQVEEVHQRLTVKTEFFFADNRMVASTDPGWFQSEFETLTGIFDRVGINTYFRKTVGMVCIPCVAAGVRSDEDYTRRMTGGVQKFKERQQERVLCLECWKDMAKG